MSLEISPAERDGDETAAVGACGCSARVFPSLPPEKSNRLLVDRPAGPDRDKLDGRRRDSVDDAKPPDPHTPQAEEFPSERFPVVRIEKYRL